MSINTAGTLWAMSASSRKLTQEEEVELVAQAARGDERAFEELMIAHAPAFTRYLEVFMRDRMAAEDLAQESFARAFTKLDRLRDPERFRQWLWKIGRCAALDAKRRIPPGIVEQGDPVLALSLDQRPAVDAPADLWLEYESVMDEIRDLVGTLAEDAKNLVELRYTKGASYVEIARHTGLSVVQVKARLARARTKLKPKLESIVEDWKHLRDGMS